MDISSLLKSNCKLFLHVLFVICEVSVCLKLTENNRIYEHAQT